MPTSLADNALLTCMNITSLLPCCRMCIQIEVQLQDGGKQKLPDDRNGTHAVQLLGFSLCTGWLGLRRHQLPAWQKWNVVETNAAKGRGGVVESSGAPPVSPGWKDERVETSPGPFTPLCSPRIRASHVPRGSYSCGAHQSPFLSRERHCK